ncbi:hypothetical protein ABIB85_007451 [Bradyrhizobium sp. JR1.5]
MTTAETVLLIAASLFVLLAIGTVGFSKLAEWKNPPVGKFLECAGVRLHYIERGDPAAPCVVLFHGNRSMISRLTGLSTFLRKAIMWSASTVQASGIVNGRGSESGPQQLKPLCWRRR